MAVYRSALGVAYRTAAFLLAAFDMNGYQPVRFFNKNNRKRGTAFKSHTLGKHWKVFSQEY
jgi:hypothetical protein